MNHTKVISLKKALKKVRVTNKKKHHTRYDGDLPYEEITLNQLSQKKYFSDVTKEYYKINTLSPDKVKSVVKKDKIIFTTPSFVQDKKSYKQTILFSKDIKDIKDKKEMKRLDVKLDCTCEGFHKQGMNYKLYSIGAAVKEEKRVDEIWGPRHAGKNYLCKHLKYIIKNIDKIVK